MRESALNLPEATRQALRTRYEYLKGLQPTPPRLVHVSRYYTTRTTKRKDGTEYEIFVPSKGRTYRKPKNENA
jgi:hypothetical protein